MFPTLGANYHCSEGCENNSLQRSIIIFPTLGAKEQCFKGCENNWSVDPMGVFTTIVLWKIAKITPIALTRGKVMVGGCSGGKILSPPSVPKRMGGSCFSGSLGDSHFIMTSWHIKKEMVFFAYCFFQKRAKKVLFSMCWNVWQKVAFIRMIPPKFFFDKSTFGWEGAFSM